VASFSFEVLPDSDPAVSTGAYITEANTDSNIGNNDNYLAELYNMFKVFAAWKTDPVPPSTSASKAPPTSMVAASMSVSAAPNAHAPQYRYQASTEDQALTKQVMEWILKGKLDQITPAHILASSPPIHKELTERLHPCCVETGSFEQASKDSADPVAVLELAAKQEAEFFLPLREIDILVNNLRTEAGVLNQGSQIVVIQEDLAKEVDTQINTQCTLHMKGANGSTSCTLRCAKDLSMRIGDVSFTIHAHVVCTAPFRLLLGRPFHHLLLCRLEDHPDRVDVSIHDPADPSQFIAVPFQARQETQVGFISALTCQVLPVITCITPFPEDPLLTLPPLTTHPPPATFNFPWPEEAKLAVHVLKANNKALTWTKDQQCTHTAARPTEFFQATEGDITLATFLFLSLADKLSTANLIATQAQQLLRREDDLMVIHTNVLKSHFKSVHQFEHQFKNMIRDHDFGPRAFVLVQNSSVENDLGHKAKPCYMRPMVILHHTQNSSYCLAELDGTMSNLQFAAFCLVPYHARSHSSIPVMRLVDRNDLACIIADEDVTRADSEEI